MLSRDALKEFLVECHLRQLSDRTIKHERNSNNALLTFIEREYQITQIEEIRHVHLKGYIQYLIKLQRKETYINGLIKSFRAFFKYCVNEEYISINPALKVSFQKEEIPKILTFSDDEVIRMLNYYKGTSFLQIRNKLIMILLFDTGIRNTELCTIKMVDLRENAISIYGKGKKIRYVPITPAIEKWLMKYLIIREKYIKDKIGYSEDYLFLSQKGKPLTKETIERVVKDCKIPCGIRKEIRCSPHTCRHYYAQKQLKNGCDVYTVSRILGHTNIAITKRYLESIQDEDILEIGCKTSPLISLKVR